MLIACRSNKNTLGVLVISLIIYIFSTKFLTYLPVDAANVELAMYWSPIPYVLAYALGVTAYRFRKYCNHSNSIGNLVVVLSIALIGMYVGHPELVTKIFYDQFVFTSLITTILILFGTNKSYFFSLIFGNSITQFVGVISYGIYLCHLPLLSLISRYDLSSFESSLVRFILVAGSAILISTLTYYLFELRCAHIGRSFGNRVLTATKTAI